VNIQHVPVQSGRLALIGGGGLLGETRGFPRASRGAGHDFLGCGQIVCISYLCLLISAVCPTVGIGSIVKMHGCDSEDAAHLDLAVLDWPVT